VTARQVGAEAFPRCGAVPGAHRLLRDGGLTDADRTAIDGLRVWIAARPSRRVLRYVTAEQSTSLASMFRSSDGIVELARVDLGYPSFVPETNAAVDAIRAHLAVSNVLPSGLRAQVTGQAGIGRDYLKASRTGPSGPRSSPSFSSWRSSC